LFLLTDKQTILNEYSLILYILWEDVYLLQYVTKETACHFGDFRAVVHLCIRHRG